MKAKAIVTLRRSPSAWVAFTTLLFLLACTERTAPAQTWTLDNAYSTWTGYNSTFLASDESTFYKADSGSANPGFWELAEEIAVAEDAYYWSVTNYPTHDHSAYVTEINDLCAGFVSHNGSNWATIAFARAYQITGNSTWLTDAETNYNTVWSRAQADSNNAGGLIQDQPPSPIGTWTPNEDSPVNFTFVIAGYLIHNNGGSSTYKTEADTVYTWAMANLYTTTANTGGPCTGHTSLTCGKIRDSNNTGPFTNYPTFSGTGVGPTDYAYNYGIALEAITREADTTTPQLVANYLMYNLNNSSLPYAGTIDGYNVLPNYGQGGNNNGGYNGIALRGTGFAYSRGVLNATTLLWAQENIQAAWNKKNTNNVMENNWATSASNTPNTGVYSWDCSAALAGFMDFPAP
jgi:hypothetical protein